MSNKEAHHPQNELTPQDVADKLQRIFDIIKSNPDLKKNVIGYDKVARHC